MGRTLEAALDYHALDLAVFPLPYGEKWDNRRWGQYRYVPPDHRELMLMFDGQSQNIAVICGRASGNLLALDCDNPASFTETSTGLAALGITTWTVRREPNGTPHDGGATFVLRTPVPVESAKLGAVDILAEGCYFVAPPSAHPGGGCYYNATSPPIFTLPTLTVLDWLQLEPAPPPRPHKRIPRKAWLILNADSETLNRYLSRSEAEMAFCASLIRAGFTFQDALRLLRRYPGPGKFAGLDADNPRNAMRYLGLTWTNAEIWIAANDSEAGLLARRLHRWVQSRPWPGRTGSSDRAVYLAHLDIVERCGKDPHGASVRELAELAGVSWDTASKADRRLVEAGLLEMVREATPSCSHVWRLLAPCDLDAVDCAYSDTQSLPTVMECQSMHTAHDLFRWHGLGKSGAEVWDALMKADGPLTVEQLVEETGRHRTTVNRKLMGTEKGKGMFQLGLAEPLGGDLWRASPHADLDQAARELGTAGIGERQQAKHIRDRRLHRLILKRGASGRCGGSQKV